MQRGLLLRCGAAAVLALAAALPTARAAPAANVEILRATPAGTDVPPAQEVVLRFDRPMVPLGRMGRARGEIPVTIEPGLGCEWRWLDTDELACRLPGQQRMRPATHYTIRIGPGLTALDGTHLAPGGTYQFTTQLPRVSWISFQRWLTPVTPLFMVRFNLPVTGEAVAAHVVFVRAGSTAGVPARVEAWQHERAGPELLPVPGVPGAAIWLANPAPEKPQGAGAPPGTARPVWLVAPVRPLASGTRYTLQLTPGLTTPLGTLGGPGGIPGDSSLVTYGRFYFSGVRCDDASDGSLYFGVGEPPPAGRCLPNSVTLAFSAPVPASTLAAVQWQPPLAPAEKLHELWADYPPWMLDRGNSRDGGARYHAFQLPAEAQPMRSYHLVVPAGVEDRFGRKLAAPAALTFRTGHLPPAFDLAAGSGVLEAAQDTAIPVAFVNLTALDFDYQAIDARALASAPASAAASYRTSLLARIGGTAPEDERVRMPLGIRDLLSGGSGAVAGTLSWKPKVPQWSDSKRDVFAEVSPWEVLGKIGHFGTLVWVASLATGRPVAGVTVRLYRAFPRALGAIAPASISAVTDADGVAVLPGTVTLGSGWTRRWDNEEKNWYLGAVKGADMALLPLDWDYRRSVGAASGYALYSSTAPANGHVRVWAFTAQGVYRPGATVHYAAYVRGESNTALVPAPDVRYTFSIEDPTGKDVVKDENVKLSAFGGLHGDLYIPKNAATGWYSIHLAWPSGDGTQSSEAGRFLVTEFVPASFTVQTLLQGALFGPGDAVAAQGQARLHAGGPFTQAPVRFGVTLEPEPFMPDTPVASGFSFDVNPQNLPDSQTLYQTEKTLDDSGNAQMHFDLPTTGDLVYGHLVVQTAVESERGSWVANRASAVYAARDRFVGLKLDGWLLQAGKPAKVQYLVVDAQGTPQAGSKVRLTLEREKIETASVADGAGNFQPEQKTSWVGESACRATSQKAPGTCKLTPAHAGSYRVVATVTDTRGRTQSSTLETWAVGPGEVLWKTGAHVTLVPDRNAYHVGDTARVLVQNPYPGARALVTVERYGVLWRKVVTLATGTPVLEIPVEPSFFPGAFLSVAIFSPRVAKPDAADLGKPTLALGYVALPVVGAGSSLDVAVKPARSEYKPRQDVSVAVRVTGADGTPAGHIRLVAAVVDEAVLDLLRGGRGYYDPRQAFYAPPDGPDVLDYSLLSKLVTAQPQMRAGKGESPGGGGGGGLAVRSIFQYTACWQPDLETDADGRASFHFKLPDNLTGWRILVMALTPGAAMGLGDAQVRVNLPLQLGPALPNQVHAGDRFAAGFSVTNRTTDTQRVAVNIAASGAGIAAAHGARTLDLAPYAHGLAWLDLAPQAPGTLTFLAEARSGKLGDALRKSVPVTVAGTEVVAAAYGSLTGAATRVPVKLPADALAGSGRLTVTLAPTGLANLAGAFHRMRDDPLEMWEVRLSRGVMAADYLALRDALPPSVQWPQARSDIASMLEHAVDFQAPDGGMAFWVPRDEFVSPYLSVYTALAFDWLDKDGYAVPAGVRGRLEAYLQSDVLNDGGKQDATAPILRAGAMAALARDGALSQGRVAGMLPQLPRLDLFGKSMLLQAALAVHDAASVHRITNSILSRAEETGGSLSFQEPWTDAYSSLLASPLRGNCAVLDALVAARNGPDAQAIAPLPAKLLRWIDARRGTGGAWPNSQENVFCTTAEVHYAQAYEGPVRDLSGKVAAAGRDVGAATFASRRSAPVALSAAAPATAASVEVARSGQGRLYYGVRLAYVRPARSVAPADAGFGVARAYYVQRGGDWVRVTPTTDLRRGDIVRVDLAVDVPAQRHYVVLTDPLPGAFEAVNHQLATADADVPGKTPGAVILWFDYGAWPNYEIVTSGFYHRETALDAVRFYADVLPAGHYRLVYAVQVIAPGRFLAPPPQIHEIYQPDVFGRGAADTVTVAAPAVGTAAGASAAQAH